MLLSQEPKTDRLLVRSVIPFRAPRSQGPVVGFNGRPVLAADELAVPQAHPGIRFTGTGGCPFCITPEVGGRVAVVPELKIGVTHLVIQFPVLLQGGCDGACPELRILGQGLLKIFNCKGSLRHPVPGAGRKPGIGIFPNRFFKTLQGTPVILGQELFDPIVEGHLLIRRLAGVSLITFQQFHSPAEIPGGDIGVHQQFPDFLLRRGIRVGFHVVLQYLWYRFIRVSDLIAEARIIQIGVFADLRAEFHLGGIAEGIERFLLLPEFEIALPQVVIGILGHAVVPAHNLVELLRRILEIALFVIGVTEQVVIRIVPATPLALVFFQVRNSFLVTAQVEVALPDDLVEFGHLAPVGFRQLLLGQFNSCFEVPQLEIHIGLVVGKFFLQDFLVRDLVEPFVRLLVIILLIGNIAEVIFGLGTVFP